jgi:Cd2+/Zn2+-exporting ATPase
LALTAAAHNGVLIKGGLFVDAPARLRTVAFDKAGTLTIRHPAVTDIIPIEGYSAEEILGRAALMEGHGDHPVVRAIVAHNVMAA